jgi:hypothetical protein
MKKQSCITIKTSWKTFWRYADMSSRKLRVTKKAKISKEVKHSTCANFDWCLSMRVNISRDITNLPVLACLAVYSSTV